MGKAKNRSNLSKAYDEDEEIAETACEHKTAEKQKDAVKRKASKEELTKKREKTRLNKLRKRQSKRGEVDISTIGKDEALKYVNCWRTDKSNWKFMKVRQTWLLKHMFKTTFTDEEFAVIVEYSSSIVGNARIKLREQAECVVNGIDEKWTKSNEKDDADVQVYNRAQNIVQLL